MSGSAAPAKQKIHQAVNLARQGHSSAAIAKRLGTTRVTAWRWVQRGERDIQRCIELRSEGKSIRHIADTVHAGKDTVNRWLRDEGIDTAYDRIAHMEPIIANKRADAKRMVEQGKLRLAQRMHDLLDEAERLNVLARMPYTVHGFSGIKAKWVEKQLEQPPAKEMADLVRAENIATTSARMIFEGLREDDVQETARTYFGAIVEALGIAEQQIAGTTAGEMAGPAAVPCIGAADDEASGDE